MVPIAGRSAFRVACKGRIGNGIFHDTVAIVRKMMRSTDCEQVTALYSVLSEYV